MIVTVILAVTLVGAVGYQIYTATTGTNNQSVLVSSVESSALNSLSTPSQVANGTVSPATNTTQPIVPVTLSGAGIGVGASLPASLFKAWSTEFLNVSPAVTVKYSSSTSKISKLVRGAIDFGASDVPLSDTQLARDVRVGFISRNLRRSSDNLQSLTARSTEGDDTQFHARRFGRNLLRPNHPVERS